MSDDELRKACERIADSVTDGFDPWDGDEQKYDADAEAVARRLLELLPPADDDTAVSDGWLRSVGFVKVTANETIFAKNGVQLRFHNGGWSFYLNGVLYPNRDTRGHVRRLCAALGIHLTESDHAS